MRWNSCCLLSSFPAPSQQPNSSSNLNKDQSSRSSQYSVSRENRNWKPMNLLKLHRSQSQHTRNPSSVHWPEKGAQFTGKLWLPISWHVSEFVWRAASHFHCQQILLTTIPLLLQAPPGSSQDKPQTELACWPCIKLSTYLQPSQPFWGPVNCSESPTRFYWALCPHTSSKSAKSSLLSLKIGFNNPRPWSKASDLQ